MYHPEIAPCSFLLKITCLLSIHLTRNKFVILMTKFVLLVHFIRINFPINEKLYMINQVKFY
jgi:hypothetical protein